jgi:L-aminopeptidase/D-esterase-like protein
MPAISSCPMAAARHRRRRSRRRARLGHSVIVATDVPLESRQLHRVARRGGAGLARLGAFWGNGGDIAVAFTTADPIDHDQPDDLVPLRALDETASTRSSAPPPRRRRKPCSTR